MNKTDYILSKNFNIDKKIIELISEAENKIKDQFRELDDIMAYNQYKVLEAFQKNNISDRHFNWNTGYGYDDAGREVIERVFADVFNTESALVRPLIVNGTHALATCLLGILRPGEEMISGTGAPYDTINYTIGNTDDRNLGTLKDYGISYKQIELRADGKIDIETVLNSITKKTKMIYLQRAMGYGWRKAITISDIKKISALVHDINSDIIVMVDNCYGEFLDIDEPTDVGADIMAGSLIKNPGGGMALSGGYIAGRKDLIEKVSYRMTCPGIGGECGLTFGQSRAILQGLFIAAKVVNGAMKGAMLCGQVYKDLGYKVCPDVTDDRSDIIQAIQMGSAEALKAFCEGIQAAAPIDSFVKPVPADMPGYEDKVIMAAGAFVQGSSIELSSDGPLREPYNVYFQGGLTYEHSKFGVLKSVDTLYKKNLLIVNI